MHGFHHNFKQVPRTLNWTWTDFATLSGTTVSVGRSESSRVRAIARRNQQRAMAAHIMPYNRRPYNQIQAAQSLPSSTSGSPSYTTACQTMVPLFMNAPGTLTGTHAWPFQPAATYAPTSYAANCWVMDSSGPMTLSNAMPDGTSNTVMIAERYMACSDSTALTYGGYPGFGTNTYGFLMPIWGADVQIAGFG